MSNSDTRITTAQGPDPVGKPLHSTSGPPGLWVTLEFSGKSLPHGQELGGSEQTTSLNLAAASSSEREGLWQAGEALLLQSTWLLWTAQGLGRKQERKQGRV